MHALVGNADRLLRGEPFPPGARTLALLGAYVIGCGFLYGAIMGTFGGVTGDRLLQVLYSAAKVPLLLGVSFVLALPSFFVLNTLLGVRSDFAEVLRAILASQGGLAIILVSLARSRCSGMRRSITIRMPCCSTASCSPSPASRPSAS